MPPAISAPLVQSARALSRLSPAVARAALLLSAVVAGAVSLRLAGASIDQDADLTRLLRAMAIIKTMMAIAATAVIWWRLGSPISGVRLISYGMTVAAMAAGPALIWSMGHLAVGAALLHGGLFASLVLLWRDPVVPQRLQGLIARRRRGTASMTERGDF